MAMSPKPLARGPAGGVGLPPGAPRAPYITAAGFARLKAEFDGLWRVRRPAVVVALAAAAAEGDRSENAEYIYRKKELREIDRRVRYLSGQLQDLKPVETLPPDRSRVFFGATVTVADEDTGDEVTYRIVGADEVPFASGNISIDAPLARGLMGKRVGDGVRLELPGGVRVLEIVGIAYDAEAAP